MAVDFLNIGFEDIPVTDIAWTRAEAGSRQRMHNNALRVRIRDVKMEAEVTTAPMPEETAQAIVDILTGEGTLIASGTVLERRGFTTMDVDCEVTRIQPVRDGVEFQEIVQFTMREV